MNKHLDRTLPHLALSSTLMSSCTCVDTRGSADADRCRKSGLVKHKLTPAIN